MGGGNIQPSFAQKKDGTIVAFMRGQWARLPNGFSFRNRKTVEKPGAGWTDHPTLPNPGAGLELMRARNGDWLCIYNDHQIGRHTLAASLSEDEGQSWKWTRHLERSGIGQGEFHYPSIIEGRDGQFHVSYSYSIQIPHNDEPKGKSIRYANIRPRVDKRGISQYQPDKPIRPLARKSARIAGARRLG